MKKLFLLVITLMTTLMASAQTSVQVGYLLNTQKSKVAGVKSSDSYSGFMVAADYNLNLTAALSVAPGLGLGYSFNNSDGAKYKELGLFVPVDLNMLDMLLHGRLPEEAFHPLSQLMME